MKKGLIILSGLFLMLFSLQCAGTQEPDPKVIACKSACDTTYDKCIKRALKNEAKKAACEIVHNKCLSDCEKK